MRKLASIQRIWKIESIEGADRIELAHVLGWQCVVNKGQFRPMARRTVQLRFSPGCLFFPLGKKSGGFPCQARLTTF